MTSHLDDTGAMLSVAQDQLANEHYPVLSAGGQHDKATSLDMSSIVNVTKELPYDYAKVMFGDIMPFLLVLTFITNTLVVMVLAQRHMRTPTNIVLVTMAIVDLMTLLWPSPWYFYIYTLGYHDKFLYPPAACYAYHLMTDAIPVFFHTSSIWLALLLAGQRYIYVCHPNLARTWCTVPKVKRAIFLILVVAFSFQISRFFDNTFESVTIKNTKACKFAVAWWVDLIGIDVYFFTYYIMRTVFVFIVPCVALITLNCLLFRALRRAEYKRSELLRTKIRPAAGSQAGFEGRQSSFVGNSVIKNEPTASHNAIANAGSSSGLYWPIRAKMPAPKARSNRNNPEVKSEIGIGAERKSKFSQRFSIRSPFRVRQLCASAGPRANEHSTLGRGEVYRPPTSRTALANRKATIKKDPDGRAFEQRSDSDASGELLNEDGQQVVGRPSHRGTISRPRHRMGDQGKQRSKESNESYSVLSNQSKERDENQSNGGGPDEDYACPGCPVCEQQQMDELRWCRHCQASIANETNTTGNRQHQPVSQCSSLVGGATNTTTNDEVSSCGNTHNISSSIYVVHDGILDGVDETASIRDDDEALLDGERENASLHRSNPDQGQDKRVRRNKKSVSAEGETKGESELMTSTSTDSRLVCGCPVSPERRTLHRYTRSNFNRREGCRECCTASRCRTPSRLRGSTNEQFDKSRGSMQRCVASCSSSDPCIKCNNQTQDSAGCRSDAGNREAGGTAGPKKSNSDYYGDRSATENNEATGKPRSNADIYLDATAAATTTTTTTLYSTQANSIASLLQAQTSRSRPMAASGSQLQTHTKSPSFVSTMGRGSNNVVLNPPPALVITGGNPTASLRSMDSNRTTLMLIMVVTVFLMVEVPAALVTIAHVILNTFNITTNEHLLSCVNYIKLISNFLIMISYSVNFTIYCSMSKKFRETFRDLITCGGQARRKRAGGLLYARAEQSQYIINNNNNYNSTYQYQQQSQDQAATLSNPKKIQTCSNMLTSGPEPSDQQQGSAISQARYAAYRIRASSQQQECEL